MEEDVCKDNEAKNAGAGAAVAKADDDDDDDGTTCPICFDPWTSSGEHRVGLEQ